jgi:hypothetical protein
MKKFAGVMAVLMAVCFTVGVAFAGAPEKPIELKNKKGTVTYNHAKHSAVSCQKCHHKDAAGKEQSCLKCHTEKADGKKLEAKEAFHKQCKGCHAEGKKGPTKCDECHKK